MKGYHDSNTPESVRDLWRTPDKIFYYYDRRFDFTLDVAASHDNSKVRGFFISKDKDALNDDVVWGRRNWCNPPYSNITPWIEKAISEMHQGRLTVMLLPADTSVKWFKLAFDNCSECHLISGRISFVSESSLKPVSGNNKGSVVFVFDPKSPARHHTSLISRDDMEKPYEHN